MNTDIVASIPLVDLKAQYDSLKDDIDQAIESVIERTAFIGGTFVKTFEDEFARYCGVTHCVGVANGTDALFIALKTLRIGAGDEVITTANSFIATPEAITMAGAQVVFVDIDPNTYLMDANRIEEKITRRTKAIIPVHLYGQPTDMETIRNIAYKHGLAVVSDAAQAHGARDRGIPISRLAEITCFSFYPGKNLGAYGDGGALVTNDDRLAETARMFANHGRAKKYDHDFEGVNSRLDGLQAAILSVKLRHLESWTERRRALAYQYNHALIGLDIATPVERPDVRAVYHLYVVRVPAAFRSRVQGRLAANGVTTGIHYPIALPYLKAYERLAARDDEFPNARRAACEILSLPMYPELSEGHVQFIVDQLATALAQPAA